MQLNLKAAIACAICVHALSGFSPATGKTAPATAQPEAAHLQQLLTSGKVEDCEREATEYLRLHSDDAAVRAVHAQALYQLERYHYALDELTQATNGGSKSADDVLLRGKICQSLHKIPDAIACYKQFVAMTTDQARAQQYNTLIELLQTEQNDKAQKRASAANTGTYLSAVTQRGLMRWPKPAHITYYIQDGSTVEGYRPEFEEALRQAFDEWSESTNHLLDFQMIPDEKAADMVVTWTSDLHAPAFKAEAGLTQTSFNGSGLNHAHIMLLTMDPFKEGPIGKNYLYNVCLHEIGHALGLQGHSPYQEDIMFPSLYTQQGLSDRDINTVLAFYSADTKTAAALPAVDEYGRPLPPKMVCERLTYVGTSALMKGDFDTAIDKLSAALKIDPHNQLAMHNLVAAANNYAIANGTSPEKALSLLHLALFLQPNDSGSRRNLNAILASQGKDPTNFATRLALAQQCLVHKDSRGAIVEYGEALSIKPDPAVNVKLQELKKQVSVK